MSKLFKRLFQKHFCPPAQAKLLELFDATPYLQRAILLVETTPLSGIRTTYLLEEHSHTSHLKVRQTNLKEKTERTVIETELPQSDFAKVLDCVEEGGVELGNFTGKVKDGIYYSLCWGSPAALRHVTIDNPQFGSPRHQDFINAVKSSMLPKR